MSSPDLLDACVDASRTIGGDPSLVLHGGGNTSIKDTRTDVTGEQVEVLLVKGSGHDLASIGRDGFTPLRIDRVRAIGQLPELDDASLVNEMKQASMDSAAPSASIEAVLHALIPHRAVLHTHADAIVTLTNQSGADELLTQVFGTDVLALDYVKPGFSLAKQVAAAAQQHDLRQLRGIVLRNHGLFTFSDSVEEALRDHLDLVARAEAALPVVESAGLQLAPTAEQLATLRARISAAAGRPMVLQRRSETAADHLILRHDAVQATGRGPLTPEHAMHTKFRAMVGTDVDAYVEQYQAYVARHQDSLTEPLIPIDPAPRVVLDAELGMLTAADSVRAANVIADIYEHTAHAITRADRMSGYQGLSEADTFSVEYWSLEQRKLAAKGAAKPFQGEIALVTGAASGIGRACAIALRAQGAAIIALDRDEIATSEPDWLGIQCDVTDAAALRAAVLAGVEHFGGLDILVPAAGVFAASHPIDGFPVQGWDTSFRVNVDGLRTLLDVAHPFLALSPRSGRVVVIGSKNVPAPGPGASAYSASKAAATQLARVAALEWAQDGIRVNVVNPDAVFDTGLWTPELLAERAAKYGVTINEYKRRNLLRTEITSADVGELVAAVAGPLFAATTGAQVPIDGGSDRII
ncbi:MAG: SDR family NAD(P)-dependent oxidoreductase [Beutenbergiaceae bacterium]